MILDLGESFAGFEWIRVTAEYSNAVLVAVLPHISDVAQKLDLPVPHPVTAPHVINCSIKPQRKLGVQVGIEGEWYFVFEKGYVDTVQGPHHFFGLQDFERTPEFFGQVKMSKAEAIEFARETLKKLGVSLESVFAEQEPRVTGPISNGTNTVPHYRIEWLDPRGAGMTTTVDMEINGNAKRLERLRLFSRALERPPPKVAVPAQTEPNQPRWPLRNPEYARRLIPFVFRAIDEYGQKLSLPVPRPLTTNHVARFSLQENYGGPYCEVELTNAWRFLYEHDMVTAYYAPDVLLGSDNGRPILIKDFVGEWKLSEAQSVELVRKTLAKLNYPTNLIHMDFTPEIQKPALPGIPRYMFRWNYSVEGDQLVRSAISAEVDANKGELKSLYYGDQAFWSRKPPIDVPILLPPEAMPKPTTNQTGRPRIATTNLHRPFPKAILK